MSTFQVPQFIEQKPKIVGFLTLPQFLYLAAAGAISFLAFHVFTFFFWFVITLSAGSTGLALAFVKVNGQELPSVFLSALKYLSRPRTYTWQRLPPGSGAVPHATQVEAARKSMSVQEKIKSLALSVATKKPFSPRQARTREKHQVVGYATGEKRMAKRVDY